jgi:hypothetical protein
MLAALGIKLQNKKKSNWERFLSSMVRKPFDHNNWTKIRCAQSIHSKW